MKKSLFPIVFLVTAFVVLLMADDSLFEGIKMNERLLMTNNVNNAYAILQTGTAIDPLCSSLILSATNGTKLTFESCFSGGVESFSLLAGTANDQILNWMSGQINLGISGNDNLAMGNPSKSLTSSFGTVSALFGQNWNSGQLMFGAAILSNFTGFASTETITASNFVQAAGSAGGYHGNGAFLTNLPATSVGGFTPGSAIFAGATGNLSQDNPAYFWDITNKRLGIGTNATILAKLHTVSTNGVDSGIFVDSFSSTATQGASIVGRRAEGTQDAPTAVLSNDLLFSLGARGFGTTIFTANSRAKIHFMASENWTDTAQGARTEFYSTLSGTTTTTEAMRIHNDGSVGIGTNAIIPNVKLDVNGNLQVEGNPSTWSTGTNILMSIIVNNGAVGSVLSNNVAAAFFTGSINAPTNTANFIVITNTPATINQIVTNSGNRAFANITLNMTPNATDTAQASLVSATLAGVTQTVATVKIPSPQTGTFIQQFSGFIQPSSLYWVTNQSTGAATVTINNGRLNNF